MMTSNAGAHVIGNGRTMGFGAAPGESVRNYESMKESVMKEVKDLFRPEFINRVDEMIVFHSLSEDEIRRITEMMLRQVSDRLKERGVELSWDASAVERLSKDGYDPKFGARPLRRLIQRTVEDTLSEELLSGRITLGGAVCLTVEDDKVTVVTRQESAEEKSDAQTAETEQEPVSTAAKKPVRRGKPAKRRTVKKTPAPEATETED